MQQTTHRTVLQYSRLIICGAHVCDRYLSYIIQHTVYVNSVYKYIYTVYILPTSPDKILS